jgi:hypothetical protein
MLSKVGGAGAKGVVYVKSPPLPPWRIPSYPMVTTILPNVVGRMTAKRKVAGSNLVTDDFNLQLYLPAVVGLSTLWVPGEESWGRGKSGE